MVSLLAGLAARDAVGSEDLLAALKKFTEQLEDLRCVGPAGGAGRPALFVWFQSSRSAGLVIAQPGLLLAVSVSLMSPAGMCRSAWCMPSQQTCTGLPCRSSVQPLEFLA